MNLSRDRIQADAAATGFRASVIEKVGYLLVLLEEFNRHPILKGKLALKGGTAINLFLFDIPRLSIDIDLNYIGAVDRETMINERPLVERAIVDVCKRQRLSVQHLPVEHAGGSLNLRYKSVFGNADSLKIDVVYMYRVPLWEPSVQNSKMVGSLQAKNVLVLDEYELIAGKLCALLARQTSRDLFDACGLLTTRTLDVNKLRQAFVVYGAMNRKDWRKVRIEDIDGAAVDIGHYLLPMLNRQSLPEQFNEGVWARSLLEQCKNGLSIVLPLSEHEMEFLDALLNAGHIEPELITQDERLAERIRSHPDLAWKALNVRKHRGIS